MTIRIADQLIVFDTGSGMIDLGNKLIQSSLPPDLSPQDMGRFIQRWLAVTGHQPNDLGSALVDQLLKTDDELRLTVISTHVHKDHLDGITAFKPVFSPKTHIHMIGCTHDGLNLHEVMERFVFAPPVFPVPWAGLASERTLQMIKPGERFTIPCSVGGDIKVWMLPMHHPNQAYGYRLEWQGTVIAVTFDHEHGHEFDDNIVRLADGADLWVTEAQYTDAQYLRSVGFGHISESAAAAHAKDAKPGLIYTTHHDPDATFDHVQQIAQTIQDVSGVHTRFATQGQKVIV